MSEALRLFGENATDFTTLGVGVLPDAISAKVTEERNGAFELTVEYPVDGAHFADIALGSIIACKPSPYADHAQPFRVYSITAPMSGRVTIDAQHISYDLNAYTVKPFTASEVGAAMGGLESHIVGECPFTFKTDKATKADFALSVPQSVRATLGGVDGSILDTYTGEYEWDGLTVRLLAHRGEDRGVTVEYGKNLTDLRQEQNNAAVYTHVYPFWHSDEAGTVTLDSPVSTGITGRERTLTLDLSSDDSLRTEGDAAPTQAQLLAACNAYIKAHELTRPKVSITVDFIELAKSEQYAGTAPLERVWLCDTVTVRFPKLGVDATAEVIKGTYDVLLDRWDKVELGDAKSTLSSTIAAMPTEIAKATTSSRSFTAAAVDAATKALTGVTGGHVVIWNSVTHLPDEPDEILIMDTDSIETAVNVWRYNAAGWGHSSSGYAGPYTMAAYVGDSSHAGGFVADYITSGTIDAAVVTIANLLKIGNDSTAHVEVRSDGAHIIDASGTERALFGETGRVGQTSGIHTVQDGDGFYVMDGDKVQSSFKRLAVNLGVNNASAKINLCGDNGRIEYDKDVGLTISTGERSSLTRYGVLYISQKYGVGARPRATADASGPHGLALGPTQGDAHPWQIALNMGSRVLSGDGGTSAVLFDSSELSWYIGRMWDPSKCYVGAMNGDGNEQEAHVQGTTYLGGSIFVVFDRAVSGSIRVNWFSAVLI